jgi:hypothetical protein
MGIRAVFQAFVKQVHPHATFIHCILHRYALAVKARPLISSMYSLRLCHELRNFRVLCEEGAKFSELPLHTQVRWLSRGKALNRVLERKEGIAMVLKRVRTVKEQQFHLKITDMHSFQSWPISQIFLLISIS